MAADITKAKSDQPIKNGAITTSTANTGQRSKLDSYVVTGPTDIESISTKYDNKFDDPDYYYATNGGDGSAYLLGNLTPTSMVP